LSALIEEVRLSGLVSREIYPFSILHNKLIVIPDKIRTKVQIFGRMVSSAIVISPGALI
jgi:hypothetical protein